MIIYYLSSVCWSGLTSKGMAEWLDIGRSGPTKRHIVIRKQFLFPAWLWSVVYGSARSGTFHTSPIPSLQALRLVQSTRDLHSPSSELTEKLLGAEHKIINILFMYSEFLEEFTSYYGNEYTNKVITSWQIAVYSSCQPHHSAAVPRSTWSLHHGW